MPVLYCGGGRGASSAYFTLPEGELCRASGINAGLDRMIAAARTTTAPKIATMIRR